LAQINVFSANLDSLNAVYIKKDISSGKIKGKMLNRGNTYFERSMDLITKPFIQNKQVKSKFIDG